MVARVRTYSRALLTGTVTTVSTPGGSPTTAVYTRYDDEATCKDVIGDKFKPDGSIKDHPLELTRTRNRGHVINYSKINPNGTYNIYVNRPAEQIAFLSETTINGTLRGQFVTRCLASTGPLTPKVNLPLFVFELKDIPAMLRHAGDLLHKIKRPSGLNPLQEAASANLAYQFGWAPLIQDLTKIAQLGELVNKRNIELDKAKTKRGLLRRMNFPDVPAPTVEVYEDILLSSVAGNVRGSRTRTSSTKAWMTVRWREKGSQRRIKRATYTEALRSATGLNLGMIPITVWKAIPFSWMIDWFADVSNVMQAGYNLLYYTPISSNFMETRTMTVSTSGGRNGDLVLSPGFREKTVKLRQQPSVDSSPMTLRVPYLDTFKLSILSSLAIQRIYSKR